MNSANRLEDTIVALATALGESGVHILRLSGSRAGEILGKCFEPVNLERWQKSESYTLHLGWFKQEGKMVDQVLVGRMLSPYSYTGEDVYEINCHGGSMLALKIIEVCLSLGARQAEAGEFTKRAFLNGKLDLVQAEAIVDLISARTEVGLSIAAGQLGGRLSQEILASRESILEALAFIEAGIDFPEDDVEDLDRAHLEERLVQAKEGIEVLLLSSRTGRILREGLKTVIAGRPNAGKSSLLNALVREERAIVTDIPGTTRDEIREYVNFAGVLLELADTAGLRRSDDPVERIGIQRSWEALERADLIFLVTVAGEALVEEERRILDRYGERVIVLENKADLQENLSAPGEKAGADAVPSGAGQRILVDGAYEARRVKSGSAEAKAVWLKFSVLKGWGFRELEDEVRRRVFQEGSVDLAKPLLSNVRQISGLEKCRDDLDKALEAVRQGYLWDLVSVDVRAGLEEISLITGHNVQESLIDDIFSRFCIGK